MGLRDRLGDGESEAGAGCGGTAPPVAEKSQVTAASKGVDLAIASYDEDSLTMAVAAARDCIKGTNAANIGGLYFASTTAPYKEKQSAATIAPRATHGGAVIRRVRRR